ncbi:MULTISPECIES: DUF4840 domain-containing protein [Chryseobacterium]|uniref:DUF4840 domain-containing protein n=1 Tax=Chryseobacterium nepalense TaxID=1854498 RepID=A0ABY4K4I7_9FLAO|nr:MULTISPECIES: DUF4840 domain-containing protein [Chryseobacterium]MEA1850070.1 DUF4840 domain-containing protein [Chryseobacterium sp. MHB01]UPQ74527.1 DUF4840 domain-containing protein [Chryseobacterium nepalense]
MKIKKVLHFLMLAAIAVSGMSLISCLEDQYTPIPVKLSDVDGNYKARLVTFQGGKINEKITDFNAKDSLITFKDFPAREVVKTIITDPAKADTVLAHLGKVEYKIKFKSKLNTEQNVVELALEPQVMAFQIPVEGVTKNISVKMSAKQKGFYVGYDTSLRFAWEAEKITVGETEVTPYQIIKYEVPISIKN